MARRDLLKHLLTLALFAGGVALLVMLARDIGLETVRQHAAALVWFVPVGLGLQFVVHFANTLGWRYAIGPAAAALPLRQNFDAWIAGDVVNWGTPGAVGGELVRAHLIRDKVPMSIGLASVAIARLSQVTAQFLFIGIALALSWTRLALASEQRLALLIVVGGAVVFVVGGYVLQRTKLFGYLVAALRRVGFRGQLMDRVDAGLRRIDAEMGAYHRERASEFRLSIACFFAGWAIQLIDAMLILRALDVPLDWRAVLAIESLSVFVEAISFLVPGKVGADEGGRVLIFKALGCSAALGLGFSIFRRARELVWFSYCLVTFFVLRGRVARRMDSTI